MQCLWPLTSVVNVVRVCNKLRGPHQCAGVRYSQCLALDCTRLVVFNILKQTKKKWKKNNHGGIKERNTNTHKQEAKREEDKNNMRKKKQAKKQKRERESGKDLVHDFLPTNHVNCSESQCVYVLYEYDTKRRMGSRVWGLHLKEGSLQRWSVYSHF